MSETAERTHPATPHRRRHALLQGHVARSHELVSACVTLAGVATLAFLGAGVVGSLLSMLREQLGGRAWLAVDAGMVTSHLSGLLLSTTGTLIPILVVVMVTSALANLVQAKFVILPERAWIDPQRLHPGQGWARMLSLDAVVPPLLGLIKVASVGALTTWCVLDQQARLTGAAAGDLLQSSAALTEVVLGTTLKMGGLLLVLAGLDYGFRWWRHERSLRMTSAEVRNELRSLQRQPHTSYPRGTMREQRTEDVRAVGEPSV